MCVTRLVDFRAVQSPGANPEGRDLGFWMRVSLLKIMVGERGFEPPTPWSRTRFQTILNSVEIYCMQLIDIEPVAGCWVKSIVLD